MGRKTLTIIFSAVFCLAVLAFFRPQFAQSGPSTTALVSEESRVGENGWYVTSLTVTLTASGPTPIKYISFWLDGNPPTTVNGQSVTQTFSQQGPHTLYFYATDTNDTVESPTKEFPFKIDTNAPINWRDFKAEEEGNDHTFKIEIKVDDNTSGLNLSSAAYQYSVDGSGNFGYYENPLSCSSQWTIDGWLTASTDPSSGQPATAKLKTGAIDFCNSNWELNKMIRFKIKDMAGNETVFTRTINGAWLETRDGDVHSEGGYNFSTGSGSSTASFIVSSGNAVITNFSSERNWYLKDYPLKDKLWSNYDTWYQKLNSPTTPLPAGKLPVTTGAYYVNGDLTIDNNTIPASLATTKDFAAVIFVKNDLTVNKDLLLDPTAALVFIVKEKIKTEKKVDTIAGVYFSDEKIDIGYNGHNDTPLTLSGILGAPDFHFGKNLGGRKNLDSASEIFTLNPAIFLNQSLIGLMGKTRTTTWKEVKP